MRSQERYLKARTKCRLSAEDFAVWQELHKHSKEDLVEIAIRLGSQLAGYSRHSGEGLRAIRREVKALATDESR